MIVLVTGGAGYIGSQLIRELPFSQRFRGATIRVFDNMQEEKYLSLMDLPEEGKYEFVYGDICRPEDLARALEGDVRAVVHLAALTNATVSFERRELTEKVNLLGTECLVDALTNGGKQLDGAVRPVGSPDNDGIGQHLRGGNDGQLWGAKGDFDRPIGPGCES